MAALKAVPSEPVDLSGFPRRAMKGVDLYRSTLAKLGPVDRATLRAALLEPEIAASTIGTWLDVRGVTIGRESIRTWRLKGYAELD